MWILSFKIEEYTHFPKEIYKLSKTNEFFSRLERTRVEKTKNFVPKSVMLLDLLKTNPVEPLLGWNSGKLKQVKNGQKSAQYVQKVLKNPDLVEVIFILKAKVLAKSNLLFQFALAVTILASWTIMTNFQKVPNGHQLDEWLQLQELKINSY